MRKLNNKERRAQIEAVKQLLDDVKDIYLWR